MDTPLGKLTFRQIAILLVFGILAYGVARTQPPGDLTAMVMAGGVAFLPGVFLAFRRVKTVTPETHLAMLLFGFGRVGSRPGRVKARGKRVLPVGEPEPLEAPRRVEVEVGGLTAERPVVISGLLRDPRTGELLPFRGFTVYVDGHRYQDGFTDERGGFTVYFTPRRLGVHQVELVPEGFKGEPFRFQVEVKLSGRVRVSGQET